MNLFDFLYNGLKENIFTIEVVLVLGLFLLPIWVFLFFLVWRIKSISFSKDKVEINAKAKDYPEVFPVSRKKLTPRIMKKENAKTKNLWLFSGSAYSLGQGKDGRYYFIGYFGKEIPPCYQNITVECETIVGADWDNTAYWDQAYEHAKKIHNFSANNVPSYCGNGTRNSRNLHGIYACEEKIRDNPEAKEA